MNRILRFLFSHRFLAIGRWELYFLRLRAWNALMAQPRKIRKFVSMRQSPIFLNLGSGPRGIENAHWVNIDGFPDRNVHFLLDFSRRLPFADKSFDGVFCEHVVEHFTFEDGEALAREVCRILRPGGGFRVIVPDAELIIRRYCDAPKELVSHRGAGNETPMEIVNSYFRQRYEHQFLYDWPTMEAMLVRAGFTKVLRASFGAGSLAELKARDDKKYEWESLYIEALR